MSASLTEREETRAPATLVILGTIVLAAAVATFVVPRGEFERESKHFPRLVAHTISDGEDLASLTSAVGAPEALTLDLVLDAESRAPVLALEPGSRVLVVTPGLQRIAVIPGTYEKGGE